MSTAAKSARLSSIVHAHGRQQEDLAAGKTERALGVRTSSPYPVLSGLPRPTTRTDDGCRVWSFR